MAKRQRKGKDNRKKKRLQEYLEKKEFRYYIFCEGQATEPKYFNGFKRYIEDNPINGQAITQERMKSKADIVEKYNFKND